MRPTVGVHCSPTFASTATVSDVDNVGDQSYVTSRVMVNSVGNGMAYGAILLHRSRGDWRFETLYRRISKRLNVRLLSAAPFV